MATKQDFIAAGGIIAVFTAVLGGALALSQLDVSAASHTITPGQSIQVALNAAAPGDTITLTAGVYNERLEISKPVTLKGSGAVTLNTKESTNINLADQSVYNIPEAHKGLRVADTSNVTIENITLDGENDTAPAQTGLDVSTSVTNLTISNVVVKNYQKNGIAVTSQYDVDRGVSKDITFNNVTAANAGWAGIAFYPRSQAGLDVALVGIKFTGTTTISNTQYGIQFGDAQTTKSVQGPAGAKLALGTVVFSGNQANISQDAAGVTQMTIASNSTINGVTVTAADFANLSVTIATPVIPGVPNTSTTL